MFRSALFSQTGAAAARSMVPIATTMTTTTPSAVAVGGRIRPAPRSVLVHAHPLQLPRSVATSASAASAAAAESSSSSSSRLSFVEAAPADPILGVTEAFLRDTSPDKLNLGVGAFRTDELQPYVLKVVKEVSERMRAIETRNSI